MEKSLSERAEDLRALFSFLKRWENPFSPGGLRKDASIAMSCSGLIFAEFVADVYSMFVADFYLSRSGETRYSGRNGTTM